MTFGNRIDNVHTTRWNAGEPGGGLAKSAAMAALEKAQDENAPVTVKVEATFQDGAYALTVEAQGQSTTVQDVKPEDLAERIARLIRVVTKAVRNGDLTKHRQRDSSPLGLGAPRSSRDNLTFG